MLPFNQANPLKIGKLPFNQAYPVKIRMLPFLIERQHAYLQWVGLIER
jgi:hypothetical protein